MRLKLRMTLGLALFESNGNRLETYSLPFLGSTTVERKIRSYEALDVGYDTLLLLKELVAKLEKVIDTKELDDGTDAVNPDSPKLDS